MNRSHANLAAILLCSQVEIPTELAVYGCFPVITAPFTSVVWNNKAICYLVKDSGMILMQTVPTHIVVSQMQTQLEKVIKPKLAHYK